MKPSQDTSQVISLLRFPLCAAVIVLRIIIKPIGGIIYRRHCFNDIEYLLSTSLFVSLCCTFIYKALPYTFPYFIKYIIETN